MTTTREAPDVSAIIALTNGASPLVWQVSPGGRVTVPLWGRYWHRWNTTSEIHTSSGLWHQTMASLGTAGEATTVATTMQP